MIKEFTVLTKELGLLEGDMITHVKTPRKTS